MTLTKPSSDRLALHGGTPVRRDPFPPHMLGASLIGEEEIKNAGQALRSQSLFRFYGINKPHFVDDFEGRIREYFNTPYALAVSSGSAALQCAMAALDLGPGDEVILPSFSWYSCYNSVVLSGATPVFCDIDRTLNLDPVDVERRISKSTRAIMAIHYQGSAAKMEELQKIAEKHQLFIIEDVAQAIGASYRGQKLGTLGNIGTFSLQANKVITAGEGGFLIFREEAHFERATRLHDLGRFRDTFRRSPDCEAEEFAYPGFQFRMSELTAAVAIAQWDRLDGMIRDCRRKWQYLKTIIAEAADSVKFRASADPDGEAGITLYLDLETKKAAEFFKAALKAEGVKVTPSSGMVNMLHHPHVINKQMHHPLLPPFGPGFAAEHRQYKPEDTPQTDLILESMVPIAIGPLYKQSDLDDIASAVIKVYQHRLSPVVR